MVVFEFDDYKAFLNSYLQSLPKKGYGMAGRIAQSIGVNSTMISQILKGSAHLGQEQALKLAKFLGLSSLETEYFMTLVLMNRAGDFETQNYYAKLLKRILHSYSSVKERLKLNSDLTEENQARYYSHWYYSAIWLLTAIPEAQSKEKISRMTGLPMDIVNEALDFLVQIGLVKEDSGRFSLSGTHIHVSRESVHVRRHHLNWRERALRKIETDSFANNLFFSGPVVVSKKDFEQIKQILLSAMETIQKVSGPSPSEELCCLNIDWFKLFES